MTSTELLNNHKGIIPLKEKDKYVNCTKEEYDEFWSNEAHKCEYGVKINDVLIPGWLYWHTQLWWIFDDEEDPISGVTKRKAFKSSFRDNEWMIVEALQEAIKEKKGIMIFGSRRLGKSEFIASYIGQGATLYEGTENVVMGGNWGDIDVVMKKVDYGLNKLPDYFKFGRLSNNLRKEIELGFKDKKNNRTSWSKIICRNHEEGNDTESPAGLTPFRFIMDEIGKSKFASVFDSAKPSFTSKFGWRCVPILTGTSGSLKPGSDAQIFFENPASQNFIVRELKEEGGKKTSVFISGLYRMEGKVETTLGEFIENKDGILLPKSSELFDIPFYQKDNEKALEVINEEYKQAEQSPDPTALLKAKMYYPLSTKDLFLTDDGNNFPIEALTEHLEYLKANVDLQGRECVLFRDVNGKIGIDYNTHKRAIHDYPIEKFNEYKKDGAVVIYEPPTDDTPYYAYIGGADPYNQSSSRWSTSLGSMFIMKRMHDPVSGTYQRRIVAEYTARPETMKEFHETCEMLLELYNAICMPENEAQTFIQYFDLKNKLYMLADGYSFLKEISPSTSIKGRNKGLPATVKVQEYYKELIYQYLTEKIIVGYKEDGEPITKLGLVRIPSMGLVRELIHYNDKGNFDRYVGFGHTLAHEVWADKIYPYRDMLQEKREHPITEDKKNTIRGPFDLGRSNPFASFNNPFGIKKG